MSYTSIYESPTDDVSGAFAEVADYRDGTVGVRLLDCDRDIETDYTTYPVWVVDEFLARYAEEGPGAIVVLNTYARKMSEA